MKTIYKTENGKAEALRLYDDQIKKLGRDYRDLYIDTSFGKTHLIETGNFDGPALLVFHGGNSTTAYHLLICGFLLKNFHVYAVDLIGHPGKSAETCLSPRGYDYGFWAGEVIDGLGYRRMRCFGGSFGGGVLAKLMCVAPQKIVKCALIVPSGINNALPIGSARMMIPLIKFVLTKNDDYIREAALFMAITPEVLDPDTIETVKNSFRYVKTKVGMPSNVGKKKMRRCEAPVLIMAGELDCLFPAKKVLKRAKKIIPNCALYELKGRGHMHILTEEEKDGIVRFLL